MYQPSGMRLDAWVVPAITLTQYPYHTNIMPLCPGYHANTNIPMRIWPMPIILTSCPHVALSQVLRLR